MWKVGLRLLVSLLGVTCVAQGAFAENAEPVLSQILRLNRDTVKAYFDLQASLRADSKDKKLAHWIVFDLDKDGRNEVVAQVETTDRPSETALWVYKKSPDGQKFIKVNEYPNIIQCSGSSKELVQQFYLDGEDLSICEQWRMGTWLNQECSTVRWDQNWDIRLVRQQSRTVWENIPSERTTTFDFLAQKAARSYIHIPKGCQLPLKRRAAQYDMVLSRWTDKNPTVNGIPDENEWCGDNSEILNGQNACFDKKRRIQVRSLWNASGLWFGIWVKDETPISLQQACHPEADIQKADHVAVWLDLSDRLVMDDIPKEDWEEHYQQVYDENPYRHGLDDKMFGIAATFGENACVLGLHPDLNNWNVKPEIQTTDIPGEGHFVEIYFSASMFGKTDLRQYDGRINGIGFSVVYHDMAAWNSLDDMHDYATSDWQWADPFSMGQLWMLPPDTPSLPPYPLQWDKWLK